MAQNIVIVDYGMGNINSVAKSIKKFNLNIMVSSDVNDVMKADKIILPGVGHFSKAVNNITSLDLWDALNERVLVKKTPVLGICLGMQLMAEYSEEGDAHGFNWVSGEVVKFKIADTKLIKIPHMGWNTVSVEKDGALTKRIKKDTEFYFVHSYHFRSKEPADILHTTHYEYDFVSAVEKENIFGVQYHPEKSHQSGMILLENFVNL